MILKVHAQVVFVDGFKRTCIYDLQRKKYDLIPVKLSEKIIKYEDSSYELFNSKCTPTEREWVDLLFRKEYIYTLPKIFVKNFPKINFKWRSSSYLYSCIIEVKKNKKLDFLQVLEDINCKHIVFIVFDEFSKKEMLTFFNENLKSLTFDSISVYFEGQYYSEDKLLSFEKVLRSNYKNMHTVLHFKKSEDHIFKPKFVIDINTYSESLSFNLFFNKKIRVSSNGFVYNGIETKTKRWRINDTLVKGDFLKKIKDSNLEDLWKINKDKIDVCNVCEFKNMCVDNRVPYKRKNETYYNKKECGYNPFISKWFKEEGYRSLADCGIISNKDEFTINYTVLDGINKILWGE